MRVARTGDIAQLASGFCKLALSFRLKMIDLRSMGKTCPNVSWPG